METIFENQFTCSKKYYREYFGYFYFKKLMFANIFMAFILAVDIYAVISFGGERLKTAPIGFIMPIFYLAYIVFIYLYSSNLQYRRSLEVNHGEPLSAVSSLTENEVMAEGTTTESKTNVDISQIKKVIKIKNYYMLVTRSKLIFMFKKDGFTKGTPEGFLAFLSSKGVK